MIAIIVPYSSASWVKSGDFQYMAVTRVSRWAAANAAPESKARCLYRKHGSGGGLSTRGAC